MVVLPTHVFVLGAGFSRAAGGPLLREMLDRDNRANKRAVGRLWTTPEFKELWKLLSTLPREDQNMEGLFNALSSAEFYGGWLGRYKPRTLMDFLIRYTAKLIRERVVPQPLDLEVYDLFQKNVLDGDEYSILTFNYDLIADALVRENAGALHYGFPATSKYRYHGLRRARRRPYLLKLHGSLSWLICSVCRKIWLHDRYADHKQNHGCPRPGCDGKLRLLIVPPMWNKEPVAKEINLLWKQARIMLLAAEEIRVIGFSFPTADRLAIDLFRETLRLNHEASVYVHNGPRFDYGRLHALLGRTDTLDGGRLEDLV